MEKTRLSVKGQVVIPKALRQRLGWEPGVELLVEDTGDGILLKPAPSLKRTKIADVLGCIGYSGPRRSLEDMEAAIEKGARENP